MSQQQQQQHQTNYQSICLSLRTQRLQLRRLQRCFCKLCCLGSCGCSAFESSVGSMGSGEPGSQQQTPQGLSQQQHQNRRSQAGNNSSKSLFKGGPGATSGVRTLDLAQTSVTGVGVLAVNTSGGGGASQSALNSEQWRLQLNRANRMFAATGARDFRDSGLYGDGSCMTDDASDGSQPLNMTADVHAASSSSSTIYPPIGDSQLISTAGSGHRQLGGGKRLTSFFNPAMAYHQLRPSYGGNAGQAGGGGKAQQATMKQQEAIDEKYKFSDASQGAGATFVQRLMELSALEAETIRGEKQKAGKKKFKN